ncbi:MAG TPA: NDP-hexose 4-ketoreductase, partial [Anaerolineae bacterium]|nr:NDP-hexose 4-ketoreductase [Anaerolineae bacterium]
MEMDGNWERFTPEAGRVLRIAEEAARRMHHLEVGTEHLLLGLIQEEEGGAARVLRRLGLREERVRQFILRLNPEEHPARSSRPKLTDSTKRVIQLALDEARQRGDARVDTEHILIALLQERVGMAADILRLLGVSAEELRSEALRSLEERTVIARRPQPPRRPRRTSLVDRLAVDLTALADEGRLDPVIGRETEIERVIQVLAR